MSRRCRFRLELGPVAKLFDPLLPHIAFNLVRFLVLLIQLLQVFVETNCFILLNATPVPFLHDGFHCIADDVIGYPKIKCMQDGSHNTCETQR